MKKIFTLLVLIAIASMLPLGAKNIKTVDISPDNTLSDQVTPEFGDVDSLILTGFMNDYPDLKVIDSLATFHNLTGLMAAYFARQNGSSVRAVYVGQE